MEVLYRLLKDSVVEPEAVCAVETAFEHVLSEFRLADRNDPLVEIVATKIVELAQDGERDPRRLHDLTVRALTTDGPSCSVSG